MTLTDLLTTEMDLDSLLALGRQGLAWWFDELASLLPASWRRRLSSRPAAWIQPDDAHQLRLNVDGRISAAPPGASMRGRLGLLAPLGAVLTREIPVPRMPAADVSRMIALDIERLSPLAPELVYFDHEILDRGDDGGPQRVLLGIIPRTEADALVARAWSSGYRPVRFSAPAADVADTPRFNFLPAVMQTPGARSEDPVRRYGWIAAIVLILVNVAALVGRDMIAVARLRQTVEAQRPGVDAVQRLRSRVLAEDVRRLELIARGRRRDPLRLLSILTSALPAGASVQRLDWDGATLRIVGYERADSDVALAIRGSGAFVDDKLLTGAITATSFRPFDLTAVARAPARR